MSVRDIPPPDHHAQQVARLKRLRALATALLALCLVTLVAAKTFEPAYPWLVYVAAFAEAATIGGLADWYAVVALFRKPLGLPIPHTAILPSSQNRVADSLGEFIKTHFLADEPVRRKLQDTDFAGMITAWLADERRASLLAGFIVRMLPHTLQSADTSRLKAFVGAQVVAAAERINISPWLASLLEGLYEGGRHQKFFDELMTVLGQLLLRPRSIEFVLEKIRDELPSVLKSLGADGFLLRKILGAGAGLIDEVLNDPNHALRGEVDTLIKRLIWRFRTSRDFQERVEAFKASLIARPESHELFQVALDSLVRYLEQDATDPESTLARQLTAMLAAAARQLGEDAGMRAELNAGMVVALSTFISSQKDGVSAFVSTQVKSWDIAHMTTIVETNIGPDLQYIRFNGTLIGGLIGLLLYLVLHAFGLR